jgi:hypothetical protein
MTTPANGSQLAPSTELPVIRQPSPPQVETAAPESPVPIVTPPVAMPTGDSQPEPSNLADEVLRQRIERQSRDKLITAGFRLKQRVSHPDGGDCTVEEILLHETAQRTEIDQETAAGSRKHRRLPGWLRSIPKYVLGFDFALLLYFFAGITNVDWSSPLSLALAFAILLAAMVTLLSYGFLSFAGHRLRSHRNHAGTIHREDLDAVTSGVFAVAIVVIVVLAVLMFQRIHVEILYALGAEAQITAMLIATSVAVVNAVANFLVVAVHALDGSDQTARLDKLSAAIRKPLAEVHRLREQAMKQVN